MSENLRKLFLAFEGNTKMMAVFRRQFSSDRKFVEAVEAAEWKPIRIEKKMLELHAASIKQGEEKIQQGAAARKQQALDAARLRAKQASVGHDRAKALLEAWYELKAEVDARGLADADAKPVDLGYVAMGTSKNVGDAAVMKTKTAAEEMLEKEPLIVFSRKAGDFVAQARETLDYIEGKAGIMRSFKDSIAEVQRIIVDAQALSDQLATLFSRSAPKARPMGFSEQNMVPSAKDLGGVQRRLADVKGINTPSQAWALEGADKKGADEKARFRAAAIERLKALNSAWGTSYKDDQLDTIMKTLVSGRITTNYFLSKAPGANLELDQESDGPKPVPLVELLMGSKNFKNVWETGKSQASADLVQRGGVEEAMGYSSALNRTGGTAQTRTATKEGQFDPSNKGEMPKYAAVTSKNQKDGVAPRYGKSLVIWKKSLRERVTHTPGDSWNMDTKGVGYLTSGKHPEIIFANADEQLVRLAAAEATGSDKKWLAEVKKNGMKTESYIETQVHGDLTWDDVAEILVGEDDADTVIDQLTKFARKEGYDFKVSKK